MKKPVALLLALSLFFGTLTFAFPVPVAAAPVAQDIDQALMRVLNAENQWLDTQSEAIAKADEIVTKVQDFIDNASSQGRDVSELQSALSSFEGSLSSVKSDHQQAADILSAHAGFDADGHYTDLHTARTTLIDARNYLASAHQTLLNARWDLQDTIQAWREANGI